MSKSAFKETIPAVNIWSFPLNSQDIRFTLEPGMLMSAGTFILTDQGIGFVEIKEFRAIRLPP
jgi:hypothetical protein